MRVTGMVQWFIGSIGGPGRKDHGMGDYAENRDYATDGTEPFRERADVYVWTARKDGTGKPVAYKGPMRDSEAIMAVRNYSGSLRDVIVFLSPAEHALYVWRGLVAHSQDNDG